MINSICDLFEVTKKQLIGLSIMSAIGFSLALAVMFIVRDLVRYFT